MLNLTTIDDYDDVRAKNLYREEKLSKDYI